MQVFVYGTLKRGMSFHVFMKKGRGKFVGVAKTKERYPMITASEFKIPVLLRSPGDGKIIEGEVFEVDAACLSSLDEMERHPRWLQRQEITVQMITDKDDNAIETVEKEVMAYLLSGFQERMLDVPYYHVWDPDNIPEQRYDGILPTDVDDQETLMMEKVSRSVLKNPDRALKSPDTVTGEQL